MKERPILFNGEMVKAILEGRKTQTRRVVKHQDLLDFFTGHADETDGNSDDLGVRVEGDSFRVWCAEYPEEGSELIKCPYGQVGGRLWVRETWAVHPRFKTVLYRSDGESFEDAKGYGLWKPTWKPSIHMFRKDSRITLEITGIRVERVQEISESDAIAEGIEQNDRPHDGWYWMEGVYCTDDPCLAFELLWNQINGKKHPWESNPFVWVVEFKVI